MTGYVCMYNDFSILIVQIYKLIIYMKMCVNTVLHTSYFIKTLKVK